MRPDACPARHGLLHDELLRHPPLSILGLPPVPFMLLPGVVLGQAVFAWSERRVAHNKTQLLVLEVLDTPEQRNAVYGSGGSQPPAHH